MAVDREHCVAFGTRPDGWQGILYNKSLDVGADAFVDIAEAYNTSKEMQTFNGKGSLGSPKSYLCFTYRTGINNMVLFSGTSARHVRNLEALSPDGQIVICDFADVINGVEFMDEVFGTMFLDSNQISNLKYDDDYNDVVRRVEYREGLKRREARLPRYDYARFQQPVKEILAQTCAMLMRGEKVILRLPAGCTKESLSEEFIQWMDRLAPESAAVYRTKCPYELLSLDVLQQILNLLPQEDRCLVSFATAIKTSDMKYLSGVDLILTDTEEPENIGFGKWLTWPDLKPNRDTGTPEAQQAEAEDPDENLFLAWLNFLPDERRDIERIDAIDTDNLNYAAITYRVTHTNETKQQDMEKLRGILSSENVRQIVAPKREIATLSQLRGTKWVNDRGQDGYLFADNKLMGIKRFRLRFLRKHQQWADSETKLPGFMHWSKEAETEYADAFMHLVFDDFFLNRDGTYCLSPEEIRNAMKGKRVAHYFENLQEDLAQPFLEEELDENGQETGYLLPIDGHMTIDGEDFTYQQIVDEITAMFAVPMQALEKEEK